MRAFTLILFASLLLLQSCDRKRKIERPTDVWAMRSVLDQQPRMLSIALNKNLLVAYNTETASLYKAWTGGINLDGPVFTSAHGPQPTTEGITYIVEAPGNPWRIVMNEKEITPQIKYNGHTILEGRIMMKYALIVDSATSIQIVEEPEYFALAGENAGFERVFSVTGAPAGAVIKLNMHLSSLKEPDDYQTDGQFAVVKQTEETIQEKKFYNVDGTLTLNANSKTDFAVNLAARPQLPPELQQSTAEQAVSDLMARSDCNTCHNKDVKTVGPSYNEIAKRYENTPDNVEMLVGKIITGGSGNWGDVAMTAHADLSKDAATTMVNYILSLDANQEREDAGNRLMPKPAFAIEFKETNPGSVSANEERPGIAVNYYQFTDPVMDFPAITDEYLPVSSGVLNAFYAKDNGFGTLNENFFMAATGFMNIKETMNVVFRLVSDDGSRLFIDNKLIIDNGGNHGMDPKDGEMVLKAGKHPFRVDYYQGAGGKGLSLQWRPHGTNAFVVVPPEIFTFKGLDIKRTQKVPIVVKKDLVPGDGSALVDVHPSFTLSQARPWKFQPKVGGLDFLSDGRLVVSTWDPDGSVYILDGVQGSDSAAIKVKRIAHGLAEPLGLKVVDNEIYVLQKQELTKLVDLNGDEIIDEYQSVCNGWRVSGNFHEFAFGLLYQDGYFYATLATAINPGGASTNPQIPDRGKVVKISKRDGSFSFIASGLRTPNGIGFGVDNEIFVADNQGDWLPSSKIVHVREGAWYGSRSVDFEGTANTKETLPVVWLPQDEIGNSPSQPAPLNVGPYQNQMVHGEVTHGGVKRVFAEKINGQYQGAVFRFTQGLEAGINRIAWGPDGALYVGGIGSTGNWGHFGKLTYGLQKLAYNGKVTFEMLAVRAKPDGIEIEFTEPLKAGVGTKNSDYFIRQWWYKPTVNYGGPKMDPEMLPIKKITVSSDRKKVFLQLANMKDNHVVYVKLNKGTVRSATDQQLWATEAWYTMNSVPKK